MAHSSYKPKSALFAAFPEMHALSKAANDVMEGDEETLSEREFAAATRVGQGRTYTRRNGGHAGMAKDRSDRVKSKKRSRLGRTVRNSPG
jgi:hypothetical protein